MTQSTTDVDDGLAAGLLAIAHEIVPDAQGIGTLRRLSGGAKNEIWRFDILHRAGAVTPQVLRRTLRGAPRDGTAVPVGVEARVLERMSQVGVPVPRFRYGLKPQDELGEGFVTDWVEGETLGGRIARAPRFARAREILAQQCGTVLAAIHRTDASEIPGIETRTAAAVLAEQEARYRKLNHPRPVLALAIRWLHANLPAREQICLVHGDFRNGNIMVGEDGLRAVLDWEGVHRSDPMGDLAFLCLRPWRFGVLEKPVGGFGERSELYEAYRAAGGQIDEQRIHYWEVMGTLRWCVMCAELAQQSGLGSSPLEAGLIARRSSESELDLIDLITGTDI